jgi:DNA-binding XRE family transcriptional regulator
VPWARLALWDAGPIDCRNHQGYTSRMLIKQSLTLTDDQRQLLVTRREKLGLTPAALADKVGVSRPMIVQIESGAKRAPSVLLGEIAKVLHLEFAAKVVVELRPKKLPKKL